MAETMESLDGGHYFTGRGARCLAMTEIKLRRTPQSALSIPHLKRLFSGIQFGIDDRGNWHLNSLHDGGEKMMK